MCIQIERYCMNCSNRTASCRTPKNEQSMYTYCCGSWKPPSKRSGIDIIREGCKWYKLEGITGWCMQCEPVASCIHRFMGFQHQIKNPAYVEGGKASRYIWLGYPPCELNVDKKE